MHMDYSHVCPLCVCVRLRAQYSGAKSEEEIKEWSLIDAFLDREEARILEQEVFIYFYSYTIDILQSKSGASLTPFSTARKLVFLMTSLGLDYGENTVFPPHSS